jgi:HAD superfamily hydrolase (TIGR01509 family)
MGIRLSARREGRITLLRSCRRGHYSRAVSFPELRAVLFDVDFTLALPGPELGPEGYRRAGERFGLTLDPNRYEAARFAAVDDLQHHPELEHDRDIWVTFTEDIVRFMGGEGAAAHTCAQAITNEWERHENFFLYPDALPALEAMRAYGFLVGLISNGQRDLDAFAVHHRLEVDACVGSKDHGRVKPHPSIFEAALQALGVRADETAMVGDSPSDDIAGAAALGMRTVLVDRGGIHLRLPNRIDTLLALPAALGLPMLGNAPSSRPA